MPEQQFHGIYPMLYVFFDAKGDLDREAMRLQVEGCIAAEAHGLAIGGLASECNKLSADEKRQLFDWVLIDAAGRVPVMVTVTGATEDEQTALVKEAVDMGASWAALQPPPVQDISEDDLIRFFGAVADASSILIGIQNAPQFIGIGLSNSAFLELNRRHPNVSILKAEGDAMYSHVLAEDANGAFDLFNGRNGIDLVDTLRAGFSGVIPTPDVVDVQVHVYDLYRAGKFEEAEHAFKEIAPLLLFLMISVDHLICYDKRLTAKRFGIRLVHDRKPAVTANRFGSETLAHWSRHLQMIL